MSLRRTISIDGLSRAVADHDLVVVPEPPLADALNRRVRTPRVGEFAVTPRRLAARRRESAEDRLAFLQVIERTDLDWRPAAAAVGEILQCWEHEGDPRAILAYEGFDTPAIRTALDAMADLETTSRRLTEYEIDPGAYPSVGVVDEDQLTTLERSILPPEYETYGRFVDERGGDDASAADFEADASAAAPRDESRSATADFPSVQVFDSPAAVVDAVLETVTPDNADEVAVVLEDGSEYASLLESGLAAEGIPYYGGPGFADDRDHRCFLSLLRAIFAGSDVRVGDVRPVLAHLDLTVPVEHDEKRLSAVDEPGLAWIGEIRKTVPDGTLAAVLAEYEAILGRELARLRTELARLGILDVSLTSRVVDRLAFYVRAFEVPVERENAGVLLADATSAAHVDRPLVCCLGLDEGFTHTSPRRPWVDADAEFERNLRDFQTLLQSGGDRQCLVVDAAGGAPVTPSLYVDEVVDDDIERFTDLESTRRGRTFRPAGDGFEREPISTSRGASSAVDRDASGEPAVEPDPIETVSQSSLNSVVNSPRDYAFSRLLDGPDRHYFAEGTLFHDFAEFYATHPAVCAETEADGAGQRPKETVRPLDPALRDDLVEAMLAETRSFHRVVDLDVRRTRYRVGLETIAAFLAERGPDPADDAFSFLTPDSGWGENFFAEYFDRSVDSPLAERWFDEPDLGLKGKIDLVAEPAHLLDFKSGSKKRASAVTKRSAMDPPGDPPNYQALQYLTYWRRKRPDERLQFSFFHFLESLDELVTTSDPADPTNPDPADPTTADPAGPTNPDPAGPARFDPDPSLLDDCLTTVEYRPIAFDEYAPTREVFDALCADAANACTKTFSQLDYADYRDVHDAHRIPPTRDADELAASAFGRALSAMAVERVGEYKYVDTGCTQACRYLARLRKRTYFQDDLDAFERFVDARIDEMNACRRGDARFPVAGLGGEPNWRRVDNRDLLFEDDLDGGRIGEIAAGDADSAAAGAASPADGPDSTSTGGDE